jgi:chemotaxis protein histidine kinase CheA
MAEDQLSAVIEGFRARFQAELEAQLAGLTDGHEQALAAARRTAYAEAEQRWAARLEEARLAAAAEAEQRSGAKLEALRTQWTAKLQAEVAAARSEVERTMVAESMRVRVEAEQAAAESASQARRAVEQAVATERQRAQTELDAERQRARTELDAERQRAQTQLEAERQRARTQLEAERERAERELAQARAASETERERALYPIEEVRHESPQPGNSARVLDTMRAIDNAELVSEALAAAVRGAALEAPRVALFLVNGGWLQEWPVPGVPSVDAGPIRPEGRPAGLLADAVRLRETASVVSDDARPAPAFAALPPGRRAVAVPFVLGGHPVAVLYADEADGGDAPASWLETIEILGRHASVRVGYLTALRTAQAARLLTGTRTNHGAADDPDPDDAQGARRYARLLVSEIKLYNESAVRMGRERRDLMHRLKPEIERARRLYDERVAPSIRARETYFQQELVQTLADGDHSLLG